MSKLRFFLKRTVITAGLILLVASALFVFFRSMPGSFIDLIANTGASEEELAALRAKWGLDEPLYVQYINYMVNLLQADMGNSFRFGGPVWEVTKGRIWNSFILVGPAITTAYILGSIYGALLGNNRDSSFEKYGIIPVTITGTVPSFFLAILMVIVFAGWLNWFPTSGMLSTSTASQVGDNFFAMVQTADFWKHYTLPYLTIVLRYLYLPSLVMRTSVVEVSGQDFAYYHRVKGLAKSTQLQHVMKHASLPVITLFPVSMTRAIGGLVLVEIVFNWPGVGSFLVDAVLFRDFPVVQFVFFLVAIWVILGNYVVDIVYGLIDPRVAVTGDD
jgi:peptide/nickel transport system permease protein